MDLHVNCCSKYFLFTFNTIFWIVSLVFIAVASWAWHTKGFFDSLDEVTGIPVDPVLVIMIVGCTIFVLSFTGCVGALRENITLLKFFSAILGTIFFGQVIIGILAFIYKDWFRDRVTEFLSTTIDRYRDDPDLQNIIDLTQASLECCGAEQPQDWESNIYFNCSSKVRVNGILYTPVEHCGVPFSCCRPEEIQVNGSTIKEIANTQCGYGVLKTPTTMDQVIYTDGCVHVFEGWLTSNLYTVAGAFIGFALLQIIPICFAQSVVQDIENIKRNWNYN